jgi:hypothetical protein
MQTSIVLDRNDIVNAVAEYIVKRRNANIKLSEFYYYDSEHNRRELSNLHADITVYE